MRVLIIEDEMGALDDLRSILAESAPDIRIAGTTESVMQSVAWLEKNHAPDLIFMDIHLSDGSAFEIFKRTAVEAPVIFTTAYDEYAIHAFRVNAVDYLLKPLAIDEVKRALEKYRKLSRPQVLPDIEKLYEMISCQRTNSRRNILVAYKDKLLPIPTEKIAFFYSTKETSRVYLADGSNYAYNRTLESICDDMGSPGILPGQQTIRRRQGAHHKHRRMVEQPPAGFDGYRDARARIPEQEPGCGVQKMDHGISSRKNITGVRGIRSAPDPPRRGQGGSGRRPARRGGRRYPSHGGAYGRSGECLSRIFPAGSAP